MYQEPLGHPLTVGFWFWWYVIRGLIWLLTQFILISVWLWNHAWIHSWNQPVLSNEFKISSSRKQCEPLMGSNWWLSEYKSCYPLHHTASCVSHTRLNKIFLLKSAKLGKQLFFCLRMKILFYLTGWILEDQVKMHLNNVFT